jgi:hypothetical protein
MTNKSMITPEEAEKRPATGTPKSEKPLADEAHPHAPQLKPVVDEHQLGKEPNARKEESDSNDL